MWCITIGPTDLYSTGGSSTRRPPNLEHCIWAVVIISYTSLVPSPVPLLRKTVWQTSSDFLAQHFKESVQSNEIRHM